MGSANRPHLPATIDAYKRVRLDHDAVNGGQSRQFAEN